MNDDNAAEYFQIAYDKCAYRHGPESPQAKEAEAQALNYFKGSPAPVTYVLECVHEKN